MHHITACLDTLAAAPAILSALMRDIPAGRLHERRCGKCRTILEHVFHLAGGQPWLRERAQRITAKDVPRFTPFNPAGDTCVPKTRRTGLQKAPRAFAQTRKTQLDLLAGLPPRTGTARPHTRNIRSTVCVS